jgi:hypothetical protein
VLLWYTLVCVLAFLNLSELEVYLLTCFSCCSLQFLGLAADHVTLGVHSTFFFPYFLLLLCQTGFIFFFLSAVFVVCILPPECFLLPMSLCVSPEVLVVVMVAAGAAVSVGLLRTLVVKVYHFLFTCIWSVSYKSLAFLHLLQEARVSVRKAE